MDAEKRNLHIGVGLGIFGVGGGGVISLVIFLWPTMPRGLAIALLISFGLATFLGVVMVALPHVSADVFGRISRLRNSSKSALAVNIPTKPVASLTPASKLGLRRNDWPKLYHVDLANNDIKLLLYPDTGNSSHQDAVYLIAFGAQKILGMEEIKLEFLVERLASAHASAPNILRNGFTSAIEGLFPLQAYKIVNECSKLERFALSKGGRYRLYRFAEDEVEQLANDLNYRA